jgi:hypothetical protein
MCGLDIQNMKLKCKFVGWQLTRSTSDAALLIAEGECEVNALHGQHGMLAMTVLACMYIVHMTHEEHVTRNSSCSHSDDVHPNVLARQT